MWQWGGGLSGGGCCSSCCGGGDGGGGGGSGGGSCGCVGDVVMVAVVVTAHVKVAVVIV